MKPKIFYHASPVPNIEELLPFKSNHGTYVYFSSKKANILVYLSNPIEKFHKDNNIPHEGKFSKWASYGFKDGKPVLEEYYPNATEDGYKGVGAYIYYCHDNDDIKLLNDLQDVYVSEKPVKPFKVEYIPDVYEAILEAEKAGDLSIMRFENADKKRLAWIKKYMQEIYDHTYMYDTHRNFMESKFDYLEKKNINPTK